MCKLSPCTGYITLRCHFTLEIPLVCVKFQTVFAMFFMFNIKEIQLHFICNPVLYMENN